MTAFVIAYSVGIASTAGLFGFVVATDEDEYVRYSLFKLILLCALWPLFLAMIAGHMVAEGRD